MKDELQQSPQSSESILTFDDSLTGFDGVGLPVYMSHSLLLHFGH